ncbi:MAG: squalene/phytoene synthase family protein [Acidobacteriota bacterium]|jgi:phytoene synthase
MEPEIAASYRCAAAVARSRARNFYYSFVALPAEKRRAFCAVYAFMRYCDDISDGCETATEKRRMLAGWRAQLDAAVKGEFNGSPILPAFHDTVARFSIPAEYFHWIIDGAEMDLSIDHYDTFDDLYRYCFRVASAVGLVSLQIFGFSDQCAKQFAEQCGIAFQLTNILRDIKEDAVMGRIYLPEEDLARFRYTAQDLRQEIKDDRFLALMNYEADRARRYFQQGRKLLALVDASSRPALWAMIEIYGRLLERIAQRRFDVFGAPIRLAPAEKVLVAFRAIAMRYLRV